MAVTWIDDDDVKSALGFDLGVDVDDAWLDQVTAAANAWCFKKRAKNGYQDMESEAPDEAVRTGTILYAVLLYNTRGASSGSATFEEFGGAGQMFGGDFREVKRLLGVSRPLAVG